MKLLAILPVRSGSKSIPNKNIANLNGAHLLSYVINAAKNITEIDDFVVTSDSKKYLEIAKIYCDNLILRNRPKNLSNDNTPDIPVLIDALEYVEKLLKKKYTHIIQLHATSPLLRAEQLSEALKKFVCSDADSMVSVKSASEIPPIKIKKLSNNYLVPAVAGLNELTTSRRQDNKNLYIRNGSFYLLEVKSLYKGKLWGEKLMPYVMDKYDSIDINDLFDLEVASIIMKKRT